MPKRPLDLRALRDQIRPFWVLRDYGWYPTSTGREQLHGPCPVHGSTSPRSRSMRVHDRVVYCFSCHFSGDAVALFARLAGVPTLTAAYELCARYRIDPPYLQG